MKHLIILTPFLASQSLAQTHVVDAFGAFPVGAQVGERSNWAGVQTIGSQTAQVLPGSEDTMLIYAGPKSLVAGKDVAHVAVLTLDAIGNLVQSEMPVSFQLTDQSLESEITNGIAEVQFLPEPIAGRFPVSAELNTRQTPRVTYRVTTDLQSTTAIVARSPKQLQNETLARFETRVSQDIYGNAIEDGVATKIQIHHADDSFSVADALTQSGVARADVLMRDVAQAGNVVTQIAASYSAPVSIGLKELSADTATLVTLTEKSEIGGLALRAGPFRTSAGYLLNDGAQVSVRVVDGAGQGRVVSGWTKDGYFNELLSLSPENGPFDVHLESPLGTERQSLSAILDAAKGSSE